MIPAMPPRATYRLQFNARFRFDAACDIVPYLARLGVSHLYASPLYKARAGSSHYYDVVDPTRFDPTIGDAADFERLVAVLRDHDMGLILDIVPNHMATAPDNRWWMHMLEWGEASPHARTFTIDWHARDETLEGKVLMPVLGGTLAEALGEGSFKLIYDLDTRSFICRYHEHVLPVRPTDYGPILRDLAGQAPALATRLMPLATAFEAAVPSDPGAVEVLKDRLAELLAGDAALAPKVADACARVDLPALIERQAWLPSPWRESSERLNYRRFFDIDHLVGVAVEDAAVFESTHALTLQLIENRLIDGLRIDHIDGLSHPGGYLARLEQAWRARSDRPPYILVEKILAPHEHLPEDWPVAGTTGYEVMNAIIGLQTDAAGEASLDALWREAAPELGDFRQVVGEAKRLITEDYFGPETKRLAEAMSRWAAGVPGLAQTTAWQRRSAIGALARGLRVYRTYFPPPGPDGLLPEASAQTDIDIAEISHAAEQALAAVPENAALPALIEVAKGQLGGVAGRVWMQGFQQATGPIMAKSLEDTAFYRYGRLLSLNEVGGAPVPFGCDAARFHQQMIERRARQPDALSATATHDHKRGEDSRTRLAVLSDPSAGWADEARDWLALTAGLTRDGAPDDADRLILFQSLAAIWPVACSAPSYAGLARITERVTGYMEKAAREAKRRTSWVEGNPDYEAALSDFIARALDPSSSPLPARLAALSARIAPVAAAYGLAQTALKLTLPGVPDLYQGRELWDFSLVDPDNRAPVDYDLASRLASDPGDWAALIGDWQSGAVKQRLVQAMLAQRAADPELWASGAYRPVETSTPDLIAFRRVLSDRWAMLVVPCRFYGRLDGAAPRLAQGVFEQDQVRLPAGWTEPVWEALNRRAIPVDQSEEGACLPLTRLLHPLPLALLLSQQPPAAPSTP